MADEPKKNNTVDILAIMRDGTAIDRAVRLAGESARRQIKQAGLPLPVWREGKVVFIPPEEIKVEGE